MNWGLLQTVLTIVFGITTIIALIVAIRLAKRRKPVWAYETTKIVGLGSDAPPELKLIFGGVPVTDVYQTSLLFFNKGTDIINKDDVTDNITIHFKGARILRQPSIRVTSNDKVRFSAKQVIKEGNNAVELGFLYLASNDGALIEVTHTESQDVFPTGNIKGVHIVAARKFDPSKKRPSIVKLAVSSTLTVIILAVIIMHNLLIFRLDPDIASAVYLFLGMAVFILISDMLELVRYRRFPTWSRYKR